MMAVAAISQAATAQAPELGGLLPCGGPRGSTTRLQIEGKNLKGARLFVGGKGVMVKSTETSPSGDVVTADISVEPGAPLGPHDVRISTPKGISNGARFWVDILPNRVIDKPMSEADAPVVIDRATPAVINSRIAAKAGRDRFCLTAAAGEAWSFQCRANDLRSRMDPVLELKDENGVGLRLVQGTWESNPSFFYRFSRAGRYYLTVRDSEYNGGPNYVYRLLAARSPYVSGFTPRGERPGHTVDLALRGSSLPAEHASVTIPGDASGVYWANVDAGSGGPVVLPLLVDSDPVMDAGSENALRPLPALPAIVDGDFEHVPKAAFTFHADAGRKILFDLLGRRIGSRIDGSLRVLDGSGKELAANDDAPGIGKDARLEFSAPAAGDYRVEVSNVEEITGPDCYYRLKARQVSPDFRVSIATDRVAVGAGGTVALPISLERLGGFNGPVSVRCEGLPGGVSFAGGCFAPGKTSTEATLTAEPGSAVDAACVHLIAEADVDGHSVSREALAWEQYEHRSIDLLLSVEYSYARPHHIWDLLVLGVIDRTDPLTVSSPARTVALTQGGTAEIPVHIVRQPNAAGEIKLDVRGLPGKISATAPAIPAGQTDGKIVLTAAADALPDTTGIIVQAHLGNTICLMPSVQLTVSKR